MRFGKRVFMTFSILAKDPDTGAIGGAAATGSLCVGGWVLRGDLRAGMSASQGASPSTLWGEDVLGEMRNGLSADVAVDKVVQADRGREYRQLTALDLTGASGAYTGEKNTPVMGSLQFEGGIAAGNMLSTEDVLEAMAGAFQFSSLPFSERMVAALHAAQKAGGDSRGIVSAALLVLSSDHPPLTLRVDYDEDPINALGNLHNRAMSGEYRDWCRQVPTFNDPGRTLD